MNPNQFGEHALRVQELHTVYCQCSGFDGITLNYLRIRQWNDWLKWGDWTPDDLRLVIRYLNREIAQGNRNPGALKFSNLIGMPDRFEEDLGLARKIFRPRKPATVQTTQQIGDIQRTVETPRDNTHDAIDVGAIFSGIRDQINQQQKS